MRQLVLFAVVIASVVAAACSEERPEAQAPSSSPPTDGRDVATPQPKGGGTIEARVTYAGTPVVETISINKDVQQCGRRIEMRPVVVGEAHGLANAVVSVSGLDGPRTARPTPSLDQRGCQFRPHVVAMEPGALKVVNSDGILHNLHTYSDANPPINRAQPKFKKVMEVAFDKPDIIKVTCDVHSWMQGWIVVQPHPYFGVTDAAGTTRIEGVPPGTHTVEVWHERLGKRAKDVTVSSAGTAHVVFEFPAGG
jgi:plastocyanin